MKFNGVKYIHSGTAIYESILSDKDSIDELNGKKDETEREFSKKNEQLKSLIKAGQGSDEDKSIHVQSVAIIAKATLLILLQIVLK